MGDKNKQLLGAISMDLKRVALSYHRGSYKTAKVFYNEALKRKKEINKKEIKPYLNRFIKAIDNIKKEKREKAAEDALLYSTIFQNASQS